MAFWLSEIAALFFIGLGFAYLICALVLKYFDVRIRRRKYSGRKQ